MGNCQAGFCATTAPSEPGRLSISGPRLSEQLQVAQRLSRDVAKKISADMFGTSTAVWGSANVLHKTEAGAVEAVSKITASSAARHTKRLPSTKAAAEGGPVVTDASTYTVCVEDGGSGSQTPVDSVLGCSPMLQSGKLRLPPPRRAFDDTTPDLQIMNCFVSADSGIAGVNRY